MKIIQIGIPLVAVLVSSCQQSRPPVATLPPVVEKKQVVSNSTKTKKRSYRKPTSSTQTKPTATATTIAKEEPLNPLIPDPTNLTPLNSVPKFPVPDNIQPKIQDGINQGVFLELKW